MTTVNGISLSIKPSKKKWKSVKLGDVCIVNPRKPKLERGDSELTSFIPMESVDARLGIVQNLRVRPFCEVKKGYTYFEEGDVLFAKITPCMQNGKHTIAKRLIDGFGFGTTEFHVLRPKAQIIPEIIWYYLRQPEVLNEATNHFTGAVGQQRVPEDYLVHMDFPLPPLSEQRRIAATLGNHHEAVERARNAAEARLEAANTLLKAYLATVFPDNLKKLPSGWTLERLRTLTKRIDYGFTASARPEIHTPKFLRITDIQDGSVNWSKVPGCDISMDNTHKYSLENGDIVFARTGATTGKSFLIETPPVSVFASYLIRIRPNPKRVLPHFLSYYFKSSSYWNQVTTGMRGGAQGGFNASMLSALKIPLPNVEIQRTHVGNLSEKEGMIACLRKSALEELNEIERLPSAVLRNAFAGEH